MNNDELKEKIVEILKAHIYIDNYGLVHRLDYAEIADALIAEWIGDVKSLEISDASKEQSSINYYNEMRWWKYKYREAEHRAARAERAVLNLCVDIQPYSLFDQTPLVTEASVKMQEYLQQAEKELEEEGKCGKSNE